MTSKKISALFFIGVTLFLGCLMFNITLFTPIFKLLQTRDLPLFYDRDTYAHLVLWHLIIVFISMLCASVFAIILGLFVTRPAGQDFLPLARAIANLGQTFPPVAVLAIAVPIAGFGLKPTLLALFLYGLLPVFENTLTGLKQISPAILEAAQGMGLNSWQRIYQIELPLAFPYILTGMRLSAIISIGTATIGSTVAAKGLGEIIIAGILTDNISFILQGGILVALLSILIDQVFGWYIQYTSQQS